MKNVFYIKSNGVLTEFNHEKFHQQYLDDYKNKKITEDELYSGSEHIFVVFGSSVEKKVLISQKLKIDDDLYEVYKKLLEFFLEEKAVHDGTVSYLTYDQKFLFVTKNDWGSFDWHAQGAVFVCSEKAFRTNGSCFSKE